jgi:hypothetical protein
VRPCGSSGRADSTLTPDLAIRSTVLRLRSCVIVAGMHRSGTSATARVINLLGTDIASDLTPSVPGNNDRGFWESAAALKLHDRLLAELVSAWDDPYPLADGWLQTNAAREAKRAILDHIDKEFADSKMFVVKDPRLTRLLPLWLEALDELAIAPIIVIPFRNPLDVAASLARRDGTPLANSLLGYIQANLEVEQASRGCPRIFQLYDDLIFDWRAFADKLAGVGGPNSEALTGEIAGEIDGFLSADLRHHQATRESLARLADATMVTEMYDQMIQVAAGGNEAPLRACFDRVRGRIWEAAKLFRAVASAQAEDNRELARRESETTAELQRRDAQLEQLKLQLRQREAQIEEMTSELRQREARVEQVTVALGQRSAAINELRAQVCVLEARLTEAMRKHTLASDEIASMVRSTSWRMTAPLRTVGRLGRALNGGGGNFKAR